MALEEKFEDRVQFVIADVDESQAVVLGNQFQVTTIPAFFILDAKGDIFYEKIGTVSYEELENQLNSLLSKSQVKKTGLDKFFNETIPEAIEKGYLVTFLFVFVGGFITSVSPCIFSMIPIMIGYIGGYSQPSKSKGFLLSLLFVLGLSTTFAILGVTAALLGKIFGQIGSGFYYIMALAAVAMGLNLMGVFELRLPGLKTLPFSRDGYLGAYLTGLFFGLVASPCATPVLAVVMAYVATQGDLVYGASLLFVYGLGHGIPLLIVGTFTAVIKSMQRIQKWIQYVTYFSGGVLILLGLYFLFVALRQI